MNYFAKFVEQAYGRKMDGGCLYHTTHDDEHCHDVMLYGLNQGITSYDKGHVHRWRVENGKIIIEEANGHTHAVPFAVLPQYLIASEVPENVVDKTLYKKARLKADKKFTKNSAVKNSFVVQEYKRMFKEKHGGAKPFTGDKSRDGVLKHFRKQND